MKYKLEAALKEIDKSTHRIVCIVNGALVVAEVTMTKHGQGLSCPQCPASRFTERAGWTKCDCGFAYSTAGLRKIQDGVN